MRKIGFAIASVICLGTSLWCQPDGTRPVAQTARQALMEMFFSKTPGTLLKHLPTATREALEKSGAMKSLEQYSLMATQLQTQGKNFETFEAGSILLSTNDLQTAQKTEVIVENDALRGDEDDIELSFQTYKDGQPQRAPFMPHITCGMKMESGTWRLNDISVTIHLPLADPDFLKSVGEVMKPRTAAAGITITRKDVPASTQSRGDDTAVLAAMRTLVTAEITYAVTYPSVGYTCTLSDLDGFGGGAPNQHQAMLIPSGLASGKRFGYVFSLSQCGGSPASTYHLVAVPGAGSYGRRAFCTDQSAAIRYSTDGNAATCMASGTPLQ
jgi:hypothetical protein